MISVLIWGGFVLMFACFLGLAAYLSDNRARIAKLEERVNNLVVGMIRRNGEL